MWVLVKVPDTVNIWEVNADPVTHVADHPLVGAEEILEQSEGIVDAIGYDLEGVLLPFGDDVVPTKIMDWLENEQATNNLGRFVVTNCRDYDKVEATTRQLARVGMSVYSPHELTIPRGLDTKSRIVVKNSLRKPSKKLYVRAAERYGVQSLSVPASTRASEEPEVIWRNAAFVGDKLSDARGAKAASYFIRVLVPRLGKADHTGDRVVTRTKQAGFMRTNGINFDAFADTEVEKN